jgi:multidrug efflux pump
MNGKQYEILGEINRQQRNKPIDLKSIYIRSKNGDMIQMDNLIELDEGIAPPQLYRYNRFVSATVSAGLAEGKTIGEGLDEMDKIAAEVLDETFRTALTGESKEYRESSSSLMFAFILALVLIYLILAAQFESFKDPFVIMLTVPLAVSGALLFMHFNGQTMNIYTKAKIKANIKLDELSRYSFDSPVKAVRKVSSNTSAAIASIASKPSPIVFPSAKPADTVAATKRL